MEGPSLVILKEELKSFKGKKVIQVSGNSKLEIRIIENKKLINILSWGKHLILQFDKNLAIRIHFLMFGSYRINEKKDAPPRLSLLFTKGEINFYSCSVQFLEKNISEIYDWGIDIMSDQWDEGKIIKKIKAKPERFICDVLMDQEIFAGVGNIIKNEVLFNLKIHPLAKIKNLPRGYIKKLALEARNYSFQFYEWKKIYQLKKNWKIYRKRKCPRCEVPVSIMKTGAGQRNSFFCAFCQTIYE